MVRHQGFEKPYEKLQVITWFYYALLNIIFCGVNCLCQILYGGAKQRLPLLMTLVVLYLLLSISTFVTTWMCTAKVVTDPVTLEDIKEDTEEEDITNDKKQDAGAFEKGTSMKKFDEDDQKLVLGRQPRSLQPPEKCDKDRALLPPMKKPDCGCELAKRHLLETSYFAPSDMDNNRNCPDRFCDYCTKPTHISSKHCRSCDRCTIGFDHHCRFINNCVGSRNYNLFLTAVVLSWLWLTLQIVTTLSLITHKEPAWLQALEITEVVLASIPWFPDTHLLVFHIFLIYKGTSTYAWLLSRKKKSESGESRFMNLNCCLKCPMCKAVRKLGPSRVIKRGFDKKYSIRKVPDTLVITVKEKKDHFECCRSPKGVVRPESSPDGNFKPEIEVLKRSLS